MAEERTLYVQVDYTDSTGTYTRGDSVKYAKDNRDASELLRRGVLSKKPVRRESGEGRNRSESE